MAVVRTPHWATRELYQFLLVNEHTAFSYGTFDCCLFAANAIEATTGTDMASDFRGQYATALEALKAIKRITGGASVEDAIVYCATKHGLTEWKSPLLAQRGDLVLIQNGDQLIAGIVHLNGKQVISIGESGLIRLPITSAKRGWKV